MALNDLTRRKIVHYEELVAIEADPAKLAILGGLLAEEHSAAIALDCAANNTVDRPRSEAEEFPADHHPSCSPSDGLGCLATEILDRMQDGFYAIDANWRFIYANRRACELWGTTSDAVVGRAIWERFPEAVGTEAAEQLRNAVTSGLPQEFECRSPVSGRWLWVCVDPIGAGITSVYWRDITEHKDQEEATRLSEERLRIASETARFGYWMHDLVTGDLWASATCKTNYGLPADADLSYDMVLAAIHPESRDGVQEAFRRAVRDHSAYEAEYLITRPDGDTRTLTVRGRCFYDNDGKPLRSVGVTLDVTERKRIQQVLQESEARFRRVFEQSPLAIATVALDGRFLEVNPTLCAMLGYTAEELKAMTTCLDVVHPDDRDTCEPQTRALARGEISHIQLEERFVRKSGEPVWVSVNFGDVRDVEGRELYSLGIIENISDRKRAELEREQLMQQLDAERARFAMLIEHLPIGIGMADVNGRIVLKNPACKRYLPGLSLPSHDTEGRVVWTAFGPDGRVLDRAEYPGARALRGEIVDGVEFLHQEGHWIRVGAQPVRDDEGRITGALVFGVNSSAEKQAQNALRQLNETLEERVIERTRQLEAQTAEREAVQEQLAHAQKVDAIGQLTEGVAHDFNNLLTAVLGNLDLLEDHVADQAARRMLHSAWRAADRGAKLTDQLLAFSRHQALQPRTVDMNRIVSGVQDMLVRTIGPTVQIRSDLAPDIWPVYVDPTQMEMAILNLVINARDAMPMGGTITLETANIAAHTEDAPHELKGRDCLRITIADTGSGMSDEVMAKAFQPFYTTKERGKGTGLGLSQVYGFARQSGGSVFLSSRVGKGTSVRIYLPKGGEPLAAAMRMDQPRVSCASGRILVVDDAADVKETAAQLLRETGYETREAGSGLEAIDALARGETYDLILVDCAMPTLSGPETIRRIRERWPGQRALFMTGYVKASHAQFDGPVIRKPFSRTDLAAAVKSALQDLGAGSSTAPTGDTVGLSIAEHSESAFAVAPLPGNRTTATSGLSQVSASIGRETRRPSTLVDALAIASPPRVLIVEDDELVREFVETTLEDNGFVARSVPHAAAALSQLEGGEWSVDALISDLSLPGMNGLDLINAIRARKPRFPVILLTGHHRGAPSNRGDAFKDDKFAELLKPVRPVEIIETLMALLDGSQRDIASAVRPRERNSGGKVGQKMHRRRQFAKRGSEEPKDGIEHYPQEKGHEVANLMVGISLTLDQLRGRQTTAEFEEAIERAIAAADQATDEMRALLIGMSKVARLSRTPYQRTRG